MGEFIKPQLSGSSEDEIDKDDIVGQIVALILVEPESVIETQYGPSKKAVLDITLVEGDGKRQRDWTVFGNLARQASKACGHTEGQATICRIIKGTSGKNTYYGVEAVTDAEFTAAIEQLDAMGKNPLTAADAPTASSSPAPF